MSRNRSLQPKQPRILVLWRALSFAAMLSPSAWLLLMYSFVVRVRLRLGEWPGPSAGDPKGYGFDIHHALVWYTYFAIPLLLVASIVGYAACRARGVACEWKRPATVYVVSMAVFLVIVLRDPGHFLAWFAD